MNKISVLCFAGLVALFALTPAVSALTVVNFDDLKGGSISTKIPVGYAGLNWDPEWFHLDYVYPGGYYAPHSDFTRIATYNYGGYIKFPSAVDFKGAWFSGLDGRDSCYIEGYKNDVKVGQSSTLTTSTTPTFLSAEFNVDEVRVVCALSGYSVVDDITYDERAIPSPEFPTLALPIGMIIGLAGVVLALKRL